MTWLKQHGTEINNFEIRPSGSGFGVFATAPITKGHTLIRLPPSLAMNELAALRSLRSPELSPVIAKCTAVEGFTGEESLIVQVMYEARYKNNSFWTPYTNMLPDSFEGHRLYATQRQRMLVDLVTVTKHVPTKAAVPASLFSAYVKHVLGPHPALFGRDTPAQRAVWEQDLRWATIIVESRSYAPKYKGDSNTLMPLMDMLNHNNGGALTSHLHIAHTEHVILYSKTATMDYAPGDEVWACYLPADSNHKPACNHRMFGWGFTLPDAVNSCAFFNVTVSLPAHPPAAALTSASEPCLRATL